MSENATVEPISDEQLAALEAALPDPADGPPGPIPALIARVHDAEEGVRGVLQAARARERDLRTALSDALADLESVWGMYARAEQARVAAERGAR